jgi:hypothetical protein
MIGAISGDASTTDDGAGTQDICNPTIPFPEADFTENPHFQIGPEDTTLSVAGYDIIIGDLEISGDFASDGSYFGGGTLGGVIDTRDLLDIDELASLVCSKDASDTCVCDFVAETGYATCSSCPDGSGAYCLTLLADQIVAEALGETLEEIAESDCHEDCADSTTNPECEAYYTGG